MTPCSPPSQGGQYKKPSFKEGQHEYCPVHNVDSVIPLLEKEGLGEVRCDWLKRPTVVPLRMGDGIIPLLEKEGLGEVSYD